MAKKKYFLDHYEEVEEEDIENIEQEPEPEENEQLNDSLFAQEIETLRMRILNELDKGKTLDEEHEEEIRQKELDNLTLKEAEKYYRKGQEPIDKVVKGEIRDSDSIVYGARATNQFLPKHLDKHTEDWDIATADNPRIVAQKIEKALDERYGGNYFYVEPAVHQGTYKVKSRVTGKGVVDVTFTDHPIEYKKVGNINYATLDFQVENIKKSLADPNSHYRHNKDMETWQRIKIHEDVEPKETLKLGMVVENLPKYSPQKKNGMSDRERDIFKVDGDFFGIRVFK